jgi:hypothetical protein
MVLVAASEWELGAGLGATAGLAVLGLWLVTRKRPSPEELERARRKFLVQSGRIVDGMLLDVCDVEGEGDRKLSMLLFNYRIGGVDYECSQDITDMGAILDPAHVRAGFPCSVRYQPGNPQNSIVVAEEWSGLRAGIPVLPAYDDPEPNDISHLRPGRG